jgi:hypothetical protein
VAEQHLDPVRGERADQLERPRQLGRQRDHAHRAGGEQPIHERGVGQAGKWRLRAQSVGVEERPFDMRAEHARLAGQRPGSNARDGGDGPLQLLARRGDRRGQEGGGAVHIRNSATTSAAQ